MKKTIFGVLLLLAVAVGAYFGAKSLFSSAGTTTEQSSVMLEKMQTVAKLVTVEGQFSEIYDHRNTNNSWLDISMFRKKALLRVNARVAVGYDLRKYQFNMNSLEKKVLINRTMGPEILYIETDINYYDITEGTFNSYKPSELTELNKRAKEKIREEALKSGLFDEAEKQAKNIEELIKIIVEQGGWTVEFTSEGGDLLN